MPRLDEYPAGGAPTGSEVHLVSQGGLERNLTTSQLGVLPAIAGAVARQLSDKLADVVSFRDLGLLGVGDETEKYQAALNSCAGKCTLLHPADLHVTVDNTLTFPGGLDLAIFGSITMASSEAVAKTIVNLVGSNISVRAYNSGKIDGNQIGQTGDRSQGVAGIGSGGVPNLSNIRISGLEILNVVNWPINITIGVTNVRIEACVFHDSGDSCEFSGATDCHFYQCAAYNIPDDGFSLYGGCTDCSITHCVAYNCACGVSILSDPYQPAPCVRCTLSDNICHDNTIFGVRAVCTVASGTVYNEDIIVTNNNVSRTGKPDGGGTGGIRLEGLYKALLANNIVAGAAAGTGPSNYGIMLVGSLKIIRVVNNMVGNQTGQSGSGAIALINTPGTNYGIEISENTVYDDQTPTGTGIGIQLACANAIEEGRVILRNNSFFGSFVVPYLSGFGTAVFEGNTGPVTGVKDFSEIILAPSIQLKTGGIANVSNLNADTSMTLGSQVAGVTGPVKWEVYTSGGGSNNPDVTLTFTAGEPGTPNQGSLTIQAGTLIISNTEIEQGVINFTQMAGAPLATGPSYANDAAAAAGDVPIGGVYRNGSVMQIRIV